MFITNRFNIWLSLQLHWCWLHFNSDLGQSIEYASLKYHLLKLLINWISFCEKTQVWRIHYYLFIQELLPSLPFRTWKGTFCRNCINHCIHRLYSEMWRNSFATTLIFITLSNHSHFVILFGINLVCYNAGKCWLKWIWNSKSIRVSTVSQPTTCQFDKKHFLKNLFFCN